MNCKNCLKADVCKFSESFMAESNEIVNLLKEKAKNSPVKPITELKYDCSLFVDANPTPVAEAKPVVKRKRRTKAEMESAKATTETSEKKTSTDAKAEKKEVVEEVKEEVKAEPTEEKSAEEIVEDEFMNFEEKKPDKKEEKKDNGKVRDNKEAMKLDIETSHFGNFTDEQIEKIKSTGARTFYDLKAVKDELDPEIIEIYNNKLASSLHLDPL